MDKWKLKCVAWLTKGLVEQTEKTSSPLSSPCCSLEDWESAILDPALKPSGTGPVAETFTVCLTTTDTHSGSRTKPRFGETDAACQHCNLQPCVIIKRVRKGQETCVCCWGVQRWALSLWPHHFLLFLCPGWRSLLDSLYTLFLWNAGCSGYEIWAIEFVALAL